MEGQTVWIKNNETVQKVAENYICFIYICYNGHSLNILYLDLHIRPSGAELNTQCANCELFVLHCTADQYLVPAWHKGRKGETDTPIIMWGRHNNWNWKPRYEENKIFNLCIISVTPFTNLTTSKQYYWILIKFKI